MSLLSCVPAPDFSQYFVSSGFAFIHADSTTDVCAVEAVPLEQLDPELVKQVRSHSQRLPSKPTEAASPPERCVCSSSLQ